ncbi:hypothetical protein GH714_010763 [Hevea brasiliensis]|uniref:DNA polymerase delta subunit 3 n=1 Tax=Hevea brasiliensis TaxID=3981 RepID=A0A6A6KCR6_HEVBR|nr:hypothetical protein GH714_010763 [Hevea brasiliensis]
MNSKDSSKENIQNCIDGDDVKADIVANAAPNSPKRRKVLKTCIDERGREVTEVVWEGEETETKKADNSAMKKADNRAMKKAETNAITDSVDRAAAVKKSALGKTAPSKPGGKTGNKMGGSKDAKQGSLLSFFNRV